MIKDSTTTFRVSNPISFLAVFCHGIFIFVVRSHHLQFFGTQLRVDPSSFSGLKTGVIYQPLESLHKPGVQSFTSTRLLHTRRYPLLGAEMSISNAAAQFAGMLQDLPEGADPYLALEHKLESSLFTLPTGYFLVQTYLFIGIHAL